MPRGNYRHVRHTRLEVLAGLDWYAGLNQADKDEVAEQMESVGSIDWSCYPETELHRCDSFLDGVKAAIQGE